MTTFLTSAAGTLGKLGRGMFVNRIVIKPKVAVDDENQREKALSILEKAKNIVLSPSNDGRSGGRGRLRRRIKSVFLPLLFTCPKPATPLKKANSLR